ncbi:MAG: M50 family metallopeptidase [bacterium]|nr:M50 family metallopeptidase [bacterium]
MRFGLGDGKLEHMFLTAIVFLLILSILVFVHELGHFLVAKKAGIKVEEFGFGLPPRVWGKKVGETIYSINALPIGGFVRLYGEDEAAKGKKEDNNRQFLYKSKKIRAAVTVAGVVMNFLLAVVIFSAIYTKIGIPTETDQVMVVGVTSGSPAQNADLRENDIVLAVDGQTITASREFIDIAGEKAGSEIVLEVSREGQRKSVQVVPRENPPEGEGPLGVAISTLEMKFYPFWEMPIRGAVQGVKESLAWAGLIVGSLGEMVYQLVVAGQVPKDVTGPVGIFQITGQAAQMGWLPVLQLLAIISVNLAIVNILPIPALDGGRLLFIGIEAISGRRVRTKFESYAHQIGMVVLLLLILLVTISDVRRIFGGFDPLGFLRGIFR